MKTNCKKDLETKVKSRSSWKSAWRTIGGKRKFYRSRWEANYARYLEWLKQNGYIKDWFHEPKIFWFESIKRGCRSYLPDFQVIRNDGTIYWVEVKGWMDQKSITKIKRFKKYYPKETLEVVDKDWIRNNMSKLRWIIPDLEFAKNSKDDGLTLDEKLKDQQT